MSILDGLLAQVAGAPDSVAALAKQADLDPATTEKTVMALARAYVSAGETIALAAKGTGLGSDKLEVVYTQIGGDEALSAVATGLATGLRHLGQGNFVKELLPFG